MAMKQLGPPLVDCTRVVRLETPGGIIIDIREDDFIEAYRNHPDEQLARAYCEVTGLRATVRTVHQTTVSPVAPHRYEAVDD